MELDDVQEGRVYVVSEFDGDQRVVLALNRVANIGQYGVANNYVVLCVDCETKHTLHLDSRHKILRLATAEDKRLRVDRLMDLSPFDGHSEGPFIESVGSVDLDGNVGNGSSKQVDQGITPADVALVNASPAILAENRRLRTRVAELESLADLPGPKVVIAPRCEVCDLGCEYGNFGADKLTACSLDWDQNGGPGEGCPGPGAYRLVREG